MADFSLMQAGLNPIFGGSIQVPTLSAPAVTGNTPTMPSLAPTLSAPVNPNAAIPAATFNPMSAVAIAGMLAGALTPHDSTIGRVGQVATQAAQSNILAAAQLKRDQDHQRFLSEALKYYPPHVVNGLANMTAGNTGYFGNLNTSGTNPGTPGYVAPGGGKV